MRTRDILPAAVLVAAVFGFSACEREAPSSQLTAALALQPETPQATYGTTYDVHNQTEFADALSLVWPGDRIRLFTSGPYTFSMPGTCSGCLNGVRLETVTGSNTVLLPYGSMNFTDVSLKGVRFRGPDFSTLTLTNSDIRVFDYQTVGITQGLVAVNGDFAADACILRVSIHSGANAVIDSCWFQGAADACDDGSSSISQGATVDVQSWRFQGDIYGGYDPLIVSRTIVAMANCSYAYLRVLVADENANVGTVYYGDDTCLDSSVATSVIGSYHYALIPLGFDDGDFSYSVRVGYCADKDWGAQTTTCTRVKLTSAIEGCPPPAWWPY